MIQELAICFGIELITEINCNLVFAEGIFNAMKGSSLMTIPKLVQYIFP